MQPDQFAEIVATAIKGATAPLYARIAQLEARSAIPGRDGRDGAPGPAGEKGLDGQRGEQGPPGLPGERGPEGPQGPIGEKGLDGAKGERGEIGPAGERGEIGPAGERGPDGPQGPMGPTGEKGADGSNGRDGTLENLKIVQSDDLRTITFCFKNGDPIEGGVLRLPVVLDRGVFKAGSTYQAGDGVTWAGAFWIAQAETDAKPGDGATPWRLAVKAGREGKPGRDGRDLRDLPVLSAGGRR